MAARTQHGLILPESALSDDFVKEWQELFAYKAGAALQLKRHARGSWRLIPATTCMSLSRYAIRRNMACPSANIFVARLRSFLGVLLGLPLADGGLGLEQPTQQTLAWLAHPQALATYIDWLTDQSDGVLHNGQKVFAQAVASLVRPDTGYLWQQPAAFRERLPQEFRPVDDEAWRQLCAKSHAYLRQIIRTSTGLSRHPDEPIADLLALPKPLKPLLDAIKRIDTDAAACPPGSQSEARHKRNALLLALLVSNPLRKRTLMALTWTPNGWGSLRGSSTQGWRINLSPHLLKNGESLRGRNYDVKVADWVRPRLEAYLEEYRQTLLAGRKCEYLFVGDKNGGMWSGITPTVIKLTRRYIPGSPGFGPHAVRHLVATDWLRRHPGEFLTVAELLNDRLETVLSTYAHLKRDDSFSRYEADICEML